MRLIQLACYLSLTSLCQVMCGIPACGCGTQSCTNIQVGYQTYITESCDNQSPMSESSCYDLLQSPNVWIVNYRPDTDECRISECDTTPAIQKSVKGSTMYRKTCQTGCLNYTIAKYTRCWTQPTTPAVLALKTTTSSDKECLLNCLPLIKSCIVVYDSSSDECEVFENVDTTASPPCIQTGWTQMTYYVSCYDNVVQVPTCETPVAISYGSVNYTDMSVSSTATYYCDIGYELIGTATITCQPDLQWSTPFPYCQSVDCNAPPTVAQAVLSPADPLATSLSTVYGSSVIYSCETGYSVSGSPNISCLDSGAWESPLPSCQLVDCNAPPTVPYAAVSPADPFATSLLTVYGSSVTYSCEAGYTLSGSPNVSCLNSGAWESTLPSCQIVDCNAPPTVAYAVVSSSDPLASSLLTVYGSSVTYSCEAGYTLSGSPNVSCLDSGAWESTLPSCQIVDCNAPPTVAYAVVSSSDPLASSLLTVYGSSVTYSCEAGYILSGSPNVSCLDSGAWESPLPSCQIVDCNAPPTVAYAVVSPSDPLASSLLTVYGSSVTYSCETGYTLSGSPNVSCLDSGAWESPLPSCQIVDCNAPPTVAYAVVSSSNPLASSLLTVYGSSVTYSCEAGYTLSGSPNVSCLDSGAWESTLPSCQIVDCNAPPTVAYAVVSSSDPLASSLLTVYGSSVTYSCEAGYILSGFPNVSCLDSGAWESPLPSCQIVDCNTLPTVAYAVVSSSDPLASSLLTIFGSSVTYSCEAGYTLSGSPNVSCLGSGAWESPLPSCQIVDCNAPPTVAYAVVSPTDPLASSLLTVYGSSVTYSCEVGYTLSGFPNVSCLDSGAWESPLPSCQIVDCNAPPTVAYAVVSPSDLLASSLLTVYGSSVTYSCEAGYTLSGSPNVSCLDSGTWESTLPSCQIVDCNDPPTVTHATVVAMTTTYNSTATYTCAAQYTIVGTATVSCFDDRQWGPSIPSCSLADCQAPPNVTNATVSFTGTTSGSYATYTCFTSHTRVGPPNIACQYDGTWTQPMVLCAPRGNSANTPPPSLYITPCACSTGNFFANMTEDEIIAKLIADTAIDSKETTLSKYSLKCRPDSRTSSFITGIVGISVLSIIFGTMLCLDLLTLCRYIGETMRSSRSLSNI